MTRFLAVCHALSIGCNTGKSGVSMTSIAPEIPEYSQVHIVVWRKYDIKKSRIMRC